MWNLENGTDEPTCQAGIVMQIQRTDMWTQGRGKESGMNWEIRTEIYTLSCVK